MQISGMKDDTHSHLSFKSTFHNLLKSMDNDKEMAKIYMFLVLQLKMHLFKLISHLRFQMWPKH